MLKRLTVSNLAIVEKVDVEFGPSLNVITGETGAGKSILMGALELVLGGRADASVVREGAHEAEVEADFDGRIVRRTVTAEGRSRAWIDEESVTVSELRDFGRGHVDIHGPRANQRLLEEGFQRETLDAFGCVSLSAYSSAYEAWSVLRRQLEELKSGGGEDEVEYLRFQVNELEEAGLTDEDETLAARHTAAAHAEEIVEGANRLTEGLGGDQGAAEALIALHPTLAAVARHLPEATEWTARVEELTVGVQELSRTIADFISRLDPGEENLEELDARLTMLNRLKRKYLPVALQGETDIARLKALLEVRKAKLEALDGREERIADLERQLARAADVLRREGAKLTKARQLAGVKLAKAVTEDLRALGFLQARFTVALEQVDPTLSGSDRVVFMFEPNPGEPARPLASIASSGEIARVMLAMKVVLASVSSSKKTSVSTLVFDEIDANIGGEVGRIVGEKMREVARDHQVIAITHLPQSAVFGARHLVVSKGVSEGRTRTHIEAVSGEAREREIARMLGGEKLTSVVRTHAKELLELSR